MAVLLCWGNTSTNELGVHWFLYVLTSVAFISTWRLQYVFFSIILLVGGMGIFCAVLVAVWSASNSTDLFLVLYLLQFRLYFQLVHGCIGMLRYLFHKSLSGSRLVWIFICMEIICVVPVSQHDSRNTSSLVFFCPSVVWTPFAIILGGRIDSFQ